MNQAIFKRVFVIDDKVVGSELNEPFDRLVAVQARWGFAQPAVSQNKKAALSRDSFNQTIDTWLTAVYGDDVSSKPSMVDPRGFEPLTPCMPCRCATGLRHGPRLKLSLARLQLG